MNVRVLQESTSQLETAMIAMISARSQPPPPPRIGPPRHRSRSRERRREIVHKDTTPWSLGSSSVCRSRCRFTERERVVWGSRGNNADLRRTRVQGHHTSSSSIFIGNGLKLVTASQLVVDLQKENGLLASPPPNTPCRLQPNEIKGDTINVREREKKKKPDL